MPQWNDQLLVYVDDQYDQEYADDRISRYGAYLRQRPDEFRDGWSDEPAPIETPEEFAVHAWRVATPPVMAPGYVRVRPDLRRVTLHRDEDDGSLYAEIHIPLRHHHIGSGPKRFPYAWQDWDTETALAGDRYLTHLEPRTIRQTAVLTSTVVRVSGREWPHLITPTAYEGRTLLDEARQAVFTVAQHINDDAGPIVARILAE
ncbi:hypothetical protein [Streptomyces sp. NPDC007991]|uniref:hypothetical protein n=1 Tax=Streptomyces sp. NPDC007991 TaxID=3364803 RepID=UPI0036EA0D79